MNAKLNAEICTEVNLAAECQQVYLFNFSVHNSVVNQQ